MKMTTAPVSALCQLTPSSHDHPTITAILSFPRDFNHHGIHSLENLALVLESYFEAKQHFTNINYQLEETSSLACTCIDNEKIVK